MLRTLSIVALLSAAFAASFVPPAAATPLLVYANGFESGAGSEWSSPITSTTPSGRGFLGEFADGAVTLTVTGLPLHTSVRVSFELFVLKSWDGDLADEGLMDCGTSTVTTRCSPDVWTLDAAGSGPLVRTTFSNVLFRSQSYPGSFPGDASYGARTGAAEANTLGYGWYGDAVYRFEIDLDHRSPTLVLAFAGRNLQHFSDESWGLDNVIVTVDATDPAVVDVPATGGEAVSLPSAVTPPVGSQTVGTPTVTVPGPCLVAACTTPTIVPSKGIVTPAVPSLSVTTPPVPVPQTCVPLVLCVGPFTIPSMTVGPTPGVASQTVVTPPVVVPAVCAAAPQACLPATTIPGSTLLVTPAVPSQTVTPPTSVEVWFSGLDGTVDSNAGELTSIGPLVVPVTLPVVGEVPVILCPSTCPAPILPAGSLQGSVTVVVNVGSATHSATVPVSV